METIDWTTFSKKIKINTNIENVYKHWATPELLCKWFLKEAIYHDKNGKAKKPTDSITASDTYTWKWHNYDGEENGNVFEANGTDTLIFSFASDGEVKVSLTEKNNQVHLELIQSKIPTDDTNKFKIHCGCSNGWTFWLTNLKAYLEHGILLHEKESNNPEDKLSCGEYVNT